MRYFAYLLRPGVAAMRRLSLGNKLALLAAPWLASTGALVFIGGASLWPPRMIALGAALSLYLAACLYVNVRDAATGLDCARS